MATRSEYATRNLIFGVVNKVATLLLPFASRTALVYVLGAEYLGLDGLFNSILQMLNLAELGFATAIVYALYKPISEDDKPQIRALMNYFRKVYHVIGIVILTIGVCLLPLLPYLIKGNPPESANIYILYIIYLVNTAVSYLMFAYKQVLPTAMQRVDVISNVNTITKVAMNVVQIVILITMANYYIYLIAMPLFTIMNNLLMSRYVDRHYADYKPAGHLGKIEIQRIRHHVAGLMIGQICGTTRNSLDAIIISAFIGLVSTAIYTNYFYVLSAVTGIVGVISTAVLPSVGNSVAVESPEKNYRDLRKINFVYMLLSGWCTACLLCLYQPFMTLWVGKDLMFPYGVVVMFCLYFYTLKLGDMITMYVNGSGIWWELKGRAIAETIANVALILWLVQVWGVYGVISGTLISLFSINFIYGSQLIFKLYFKNGKLQEFFLDHMKYFLATVAVCIPTIYICNLIPDGDILLLLGKLVVCAVIPAVLYILIFYHTNIYFDSMNWLLEKLNLKNELRFLLPKE